MTVLYVIRHGETDWNAQGIWQGQADVPLNAVGHRQAQLLARRLHREQVQVDRIYTSDLLRAAETAQAVASVLGMQPQPVRALREIDVGNWSGKRRDEVIALDPELFHRIEAGEDLPRGGAERFADLKARVAAFADQLVAEYPAATLMLVTHGGSVRALVQHALEQGAGFVRPPGHYGNTALSIIIGTAQGWAVERFNDTQHLNDMGQAIDMMAPADDSETA